MQNRKYNVLVLTDHRGHSDQNSIYALLREMVGHAQCQSLYVASRGLQENEGFFYRHLGTPLYGAEVDRGFQFSESGDAYFKRLSVINLQDVDLVFLRLPRPIGDDFLLGLKEKMPQSVFVNDPHGIIRTSSKAYLTNFKGYCPPLDLCGSIQEVFDHAQRMAIVVKPLKEYGGKGVVKIKGSVVYQGRQQLSWENYVKTLEDEIRQEGGVLVMKYLKNVTQGDKRILVVGGEIMAASLRLPEKGNWLCNVAQGGEAVSTEPTMEEIEMVGAVAPVLQDEGILIFGMDTLVEDDGSRVLSEINTLSIGGFPQAQEQTGKPIIKMTIQKIFEYADNFA